MDQIGKQKKIHCAIIEKLIQTNIIGSLKKVKIAIL